VSTFIFASNLRQVRDNLRQVSDLFFVSIVNRCLLTFLVFSIIFYCMSSLSFSFGFDLIFSIVCLLIFYFLLDILWSGVPCISFLLSFYSIVFYLFFSL